MARIYEAKEGVTIPLGRRGENEALQVRVDITSWVENYGNGTFGGLAQRPGDEEPYPVTITLDGNFACWTVDDVDTAVEGFGRYELDYFVGDVLAKSMIWRTEIQPSMADAGPVPDPYESWVEDVLEMGARVLGSVDPTLSVSGAAADAKVTGDRLADLKSAIGEVVLFTPSPNFFPGFTEDGYLANADGSEVDSTAYVRCDYLPVDMTQGTTLYILRQTGAWGLRVFFYNASKVHISNTVVFPSNTEARSTSYTMPEGTAYIRTYRTVAATGWLSFSQTQVTQYYEPNVEFTSIKDGVIEKENLADDVQETLTVADNLKNDLTKTKVINIFDGTFPESGYIDADGSDAVNANYMRTDYIPVDDGNDKIYFLRTAQPYLLQCFFYDDQKAAVGTRTRLFAGDATILKTAIAIPVGAAYVRMYTAVADYAGNLMLSYDYHEEYITPGDHYEIKDGLINAEKPFYGKTIAFLGDSIIGNFNDGTGVCEIMADKTGATIINCAFGGTRMGYRHSAYGDTTPGASGYVDGATDAQKNQVDQYRMWNSLSGVDIATAIASGTWTSQEYAAANLSGAFDYFVARIAAMKAIDWTRIDYILWEYGTNDFATGVVLSDESDTDNYFAFDNAYREAIEQILTEYPNVQIIPITPIWRWWPEEGTGACLYDSNTHTMDDYTGAARLLTAFVAKAQDIAKEYQLPCIDDYYTLGANKFTRLQYFNSTDGTHPNEQGRERIAEHIASQLDSVV